MFANTELIQAFGEEIEIFRQREFTSFSCEVPFIDATIDVLDNINKAAGGQSVRTKVKKLHPKPNVWYDRPDWVKDKDPELADLLFIANFHSSSGVEKRRAMLSQAKYAKKDPDGREDWRWKIQMHQYVLLHEISDLEFCIVDPPTGASFSLAPENDSFTNYSFASDFELPFFHSTVDMRPSLLNPSGYKTTQLDHRDSADRPNGIEFLYAIVKRFLCESWGETFERGDPIYELIEHLYAECDSLYPSASANALPDGGFVDNPDDGLAVVQFDLGPENIEFEAHDQEGLLF